MHMQGECQNENFEHSPHVACPLNLHNMHIFSALSLYLQYRLLLDLRGTIDFLLVLYPYYPPILAFLLQCAN